MVIERSLDGLAPDFRDKVINIIDFLGVHNVPLKVFETLRPPHRQKKLVDQGYSKTMKSKHISGEAVDFVVKIDGKWSWDYDRYKLCYALFGTIAKHFGVEWGGDWKSFKDYPHIQRKA